MFAKIKKNYFILVFTILFLYFFFNLLDGERGLFSYFEKKSILDELNYEKIEIKNRIGKGSHGMFISLTTIQLPSMVYKHQT